MLVSFQYSIDRDVSNVKKILEKKPATDPWKDSSPLAVWGKQRDATPEMVKSFVAEWHNNNTDLIERQLSLFSQTWGAIEAVVFERLKYILNIPELSAESYTAYLTMAQRCPFNATDKWFMVRIGDDDCVGTAAHELMHIEFISKYKDQLCASGLSEEYFWDLQEALTVILNAEMADILLQPDDGYKQHAALRHQILDIWQESKDIDVVLSKVKVA